MRVLLTLVAMALVAQVSAAESLRVDGIPITGALRDVSVSDLHETIVAFELTRYEKPAALEVISKKEIHAYLQSQDLGWMPMRRVWVCESPPCLSSSPVLKWQVVGRVIWGIPEALRVLGTAPVVYVFPVTTPHKPHLDAKHMRLLGPEARTKLQRLLSDERNWFHGSADLVWPQTLPTDVGFLFRQGQNELVLFLPFYQGTFNGENTGGTLETTKEMEDWKHQYAQPELAVQCCTAFSPIERFQQEYEHEKSECAKTGKAVLVIPTTPDGNHGSFTCVPPDDPRYGAQHPTEPEPPLTNLSPLLVALIGQKVDVALDRLGGPQTIAGDVVYEWSSSTVYAVPHTTLRDEERTKECSIQLVVNPDTRAIKLFGWTEKRGGCQTYARRLIGPGTP